MHDQMVCQNSRKVLSNAPPLGKPATAAAALAASPLATTASVALWLGKCRCVVIALLFHDLLNLHLRLIPTRGEATPVFLTSSKTMPQHAVGKTSKCCCKHGTPYVFPFKQRVLLTLPSWLANLFFSLEASFCCCRCNHAITPRSRMRVGASHGASERLPGTLY